MATPWYRYKPPTIDNIEQILESTLSGGQVLQKLWHPTYASFLSPKSLFCFPKWTKQTNKRITGKLVWHCEIWHSHNGNEVISAVYRNDLYSYANWLQWLQWKKFTISRIWLFFQVRELENPGEVYRTCMDIMCKLAAKGLIHCDFNEFNLLVSSNFNLFPCTLIILLSDFGCTHLLISAYFDTTRRVSVFEYIYDSHKTCIPQGIKN